MTIDAINLRCVFVAGCRGRVALATKGSLMDRCTRVAFAVVFVLLSIGRAAADSSLRLEAGATTALTDELEIEPGFIVGGAVALTRWEPRSGVALVPQLGLVLARRSASAVADGADDGSHTQDVLELPLLLRGELTAGNRTFYLMGGVFGSALLRAQTMDDSSSPVDLGWVAAGGFTLASLAGGELSLEVRYQRGYRAFLHDGDGKPETLSLLLGYGLRSGGGESSSSRNPSLALKGGLVATRLQLSRATPSDYRPGFSFGGSYSPFRFGSWIALMPQLDGVVRPPQRGRDRASRWLPGHGFHRAIATRPRRAGRFWQHRLRNWRNLRLRMATR